MFTEFLKFELKYRLKRPATYIYFFIFFLLSFLAVTTDFVTIGGATGNVFRNSPYVITLFVSILSVFGIFVTSAIMGVPVYRDLEHKSALFLFSLPFSKGGYLFGRFFGSFIVLTFVFTSIAFGIMLGSVMPWVEADTIGPFHLLGYINAYAFIMLPNLLFTGMIFFSLVILTRSIVASYAGSAILFVTYLIGNSITSDLDNKELAMIIDAYGIQAFEQITRYFSVNDKNTVALPLTGMLIANRLLWMGIGVILLTLTYFRFSIPKFIAPSGKGKKEKAASKIVEDAYTLTLPRVDVTLRARLFLRRMFTLGWYDFRSITRDFLFISILLAGAIFLFMDGWYADQSYGTTVFSETYLMVEIGNFTFGLIAYAVLIFFTGELVWKDRRYKIAQIIDASPAPTWMLWGSKFVSIFWISLLMALLIPFAGIIMQLVKGYYQIDFGLYAKELLFNYLPGYIIFATFTFFIHTLANNKYLSFFLIITLLLVFSIFLPQIGWNHPIYRFLAIPGYTISAMNGYGHFWEATAWFTLYWGLFGILLLVISNQLWVRGTDTAFKTRIRQFGRAFKGSVLPFTAIVMMLFLATGGFIFYNTNVLNEYRTEKTVEKWQVAFENKYKQYQNIRQPRVTDVFIEMDLYPEKLMAEAFGHYWMKNKWDSPIDSVHVMMTRNYDISKLEFNRSAEEVVYDPDYEYRIFKFSPPLDSGDSVRLDFAFTYEREGFNTSNSGTRLVHNGSFISSSIFPSIGYEGRYEMGNKKDRKKYGLPERDRLPDVMDSVGLMNNYISSDADWVNFETVISTHPDQIAVAPGYLQKEWTEDGRRHFHYKMDAPILRFFSFLSADYELFEDTFESPYFNNPVEFQIFYQKGHEYNLERMREGAQKALEYCSKNFSPYQHKQARILEFPRYSSFAQSFPNTIPYSESIGFIAKIDDEDMEDIDMPFYVTAHEIAHQWWAHQVIGGTVKGMTVMSETLSQYVALMVMEQKYGKEKMRKFLEYELDRYLSGRSTESDKELPLLYNENQGYIHYRKGSVIMYALKEYIGEDSVNAALKRYVDAVAFQEAPYTNSVEFISYIRQVVPDSLDQMVDDMFEKITLYENRGVEAIASKKGDELYEVTFTFDTKKMYSDTLGREEIVPMNEYLEIGLFSDKDAREPIYMARHLVKDGENSIKIEVPEEPLKAGIDPYCLLVDRNPDDNLVSVKTE